MRGEPPRLGTDYLDLYLLHWPVPSTQFSDVVAGFERLRAAGKIRAWGVSNFNTSQMEDLFRVPDGDRCATNQVPYSLNNRSIERDLLPWCKQHNMPVMAYSPLGGDDNLVIGDRRWRRSAPHTVARRPRLRWPGSSATAMSSRFPNPASPAHVKENAVALSLTLKPEELQKLDAAYPGPSSAN